MSTMITNKTGVLMSALDGGVCITYVGRDVDTGITELLLVPILPKYIEENLNHIGEMVEFEIVASTDNHNKVREFAKVKYYLP